MSQEHIGGDGLAPPAQAHTRDEEKGVKAGGDGPPSYSHLENGENGQGKKNVTDAIKDEDWATRTGVSMDSFKCREYGRGIVELDRCMKPRHLNMIAIGEKQALFASRQHIPLM